MNKGIKWKYTLVFLTLIFSAILLAPTFYKNIPDWWKKYLAPHGLKLGLDLQGGVHLVLKLDIDKAIEDTLENAKEDLKGALLEKGISAVETRTADKRQITLTLPNTKAVETLNDIIKGKSTDLDIKVDAAPGTFPKITLALAKARVNQIDQNAVLQALEIIRNRVDQFGVAEAVIVRQGKDEIVVQLPGEADPKRAIALTVQTAQLQFKLVADDGKVDVKKLIEEAEQAGQWKKGGDRRALNLALQGKLPPGTEIYFETRKDPQTLVETTTPLLVKTQAMMTGAMVKDAQPRIGGTFNEPYVSLDLNNQGGKIFADVTTENVGKRFAIILDDVVRSAPVIREKILGGSAMISGNFKYEEANDLAIVLRVGALPAPLKVIQNLTVDASLGSDSIKQGVSSGLLGTFLVVAFMVVYYRLSGSIANVAMVINVFLQIAGLAALQATLTLPGIAGIILSIGMAVDSNILIYERAREELAIGRTALSSIDAGFDRVFWTIVDAHVSTLVTALVLFMFGTGPIKGFAVTLSLGIVVNLFTTLFCSRLFFDHLFVAGHITKIHFLELIKKPSLDYMGARKFTFTASGIFCLLGVYAFVQILLGNASMGVDFSGGTLLLYRSEQSFNLDEVRPVLAQANLEGLELQKVTNQNQLIVKLKKSEEIVESIAEKVDNLLNTSLPDKKFTIESQTEIGAAVSENLRSKAVQAVLYSMIAVILYLAMRFDFRFGVAAAIATFHDVLVVLGICWLLNMEITLLIVTALLTLAGYSLNDTVVIFDRIRENLHKSELDFPSPDLVNRSVNEVLSRSIVTVLTVFFTVACLYFLGGPVLHDFSFALLIGLIVGTYSSVFIASPVLFIGRKEHAASAS